MSAEMQNMKEETYSGNDSRFESVYLPEFLSQVSLFLAFVRIIICEYLNN